MVNPSRLLFIHGLEGSSRGFKATLLRQLFPGMVIPDFTGDFWQRMAALEQVIGDTTGWTIAGSSLGGLMAAVFACQHPQQVDRLILLAPALAVLDLEQYPLPPYPGPVTIYHGRMDEVVSVHRTQDVAEQLFPNLEFHVVDATHDLNAFVQTLDWPALVEGKA